MCNISFVIYRYVDIWEHIWMFGYMNIWIYEYICVYIYTIRNSFDAGLGGRFADSLDSDAESEVFLC